MTSLPAVVRLLVAPDALVLPPRESSRWPQVARLAEGAQVVLYDDRPLGRARLRRIAAQLGLRIETEYVVLPRWGSPTFVVEDHPTALAWLWATLATVPPGVARGAWAADTVIRAVSAGRMLRLVGLLAPGRFVVARRG